MKVYSAMRSMIPYQQDGIRLPKGDPTGFGTVAFLVSPTRQEGVNLLSSNVIDYKVGMYKNYMIDFVYREKIGFKKYTKNNTGAFKKEFGTYTFKPTLKMVNNSNKVSVMKRKLNLIVNLGEWHDIYFKFRVKASNEKTCTNYMKFLGEKINDDRMSEYKKVILIDLDQWLTEGKKLSYDRSHMTNPVVIFLVSLYKFPEALASLNGCDIVFFSRKMNKAMKIEYTDMIQKHYPKIKSKIVNMIPKVCMDEESMDETIIDGVSTDKPLSEMSASEIITSVKSQENAKNDEIREKIISKLTRNLMGNTEDISQEFDDDEDEQDTEIQSDDDNINEIKNMASNYIDEHPELLKEDGIDNAVKEVSQEIKRKVYIKEYAPKYTDKQLKEIKKLTDEQNAVIGDLNESIKDLKTKTVEELDFSDIVKTSNTDIAKSKFANFDRAYNKKKMQKDIDNAVGQLANASKKIFVVGKEEIDSSTPMDLKKTLVYHLKDENGRKMTLKFDVPIIIDDHYMYIKGNKKVIQHMLILKPLVKTGDDTVQIVSNYQKMFIFRKGHADLKSNAIMKFIMSNKDEFEVVTGNGTALNKKYKTSLEYNMLAKKVVQFQVGYSLIILDMKKLLDTMDKEHIKYDYIDTTKNIIIGIDTKDKTPIYTHEDSSFNEALLNLMPEDYVEAVKKIGRKSNGSKLLMYSETKPLQKNVPLILVLLYFEGFKKVMEKAKIEYEIISKEDADIRDIDLFEWGLTELSDGYIKWKRYPSENSMLMNGLSHIPIHLYSMEELESKDTYMYLLTNIYSYASQSFNLDQYYDFMIDPITKEILSDMHLPTDLVSLCLLANKMLKKEEYSSESNMNNMRLRSNEVIAYHVYKAITSAYNAKNGYRKTQHYKKSSPITIDQNAVMKSLAKQPASVVTDASSLNPVFEVSSLRKVTYKGENGTNESHAFKLPVRAYNDSMLGVLGITTSNDGEVGVNRQLTLEPNITSTRGYIDVAGKENVENLSTANLLTPSEMLTPLGVQHDDPARTAMAFKQSMYMLMPEQSDSVLVGNGMEKVLPYHLSSEFTIVAEDDGKIVDKNDDFVVIQYKNGKYRTIDTSMKIRKNSSSGFFIETRLVCNKKIGDKVKKNEVVAWNDKAFDKVGNNADVSMRLGPLLKVAIVPEWDIYEDSAPITAAASEKMSATLVASVTVTLNKDAYVSKFVKVGDKINAGESIIVYDNYHEDEEVVAMLKELRDDIAEDVMETNYTTEKSHYTGVIADMDIISTVPLDDLSPSLQKIVGKYWNSLKKKDKFLDKYKNTGDMKYYKSGNIINKAPGPVQPDDQGKVKGKRVDEGVMITVYIAYKDVMSRGDKLSSEFALKSINSHVIEKGLEPYSEFRPDESIDLITAPLSVSARKTPSIFIAMFANKLMIEAKRHLKEYWKE